MKYAFIHFSFLLHFLIHMCMVTDIPHGSLVGFECKFKSFERKFEPFKCKFEPFEWKFEEFKCKFEPFKRKFEPFECKFYLSNGNSNHSNGNSQPLLFHSYYIPSTDTSYIHQNQGSIFCMIGISALFSPNFRYRDLKLQDCVLEECSDIEGLLIVSLPFSDRRDHWHFTKAPQLHS